MPPRRGRRQLAQLDPGMTAKKGAKAIDRLGHGVSRALHTRAVDDRLTPDLDRASMLGAQQFHGTTDPAEAECWMARIERVLNVMSCPYDRRVLLTSFFLKEDAYLWWETLKRSCVDPTTITWEEFKNAFYEHYFSRAYLDAKRAEFLRLVQGSMNVAEYERRFTMLSRFCPALVEDEGNKCERFKSGLRDSIRHLITAVEYTFYAPLVQAAKRVERSLKAQRHRELGCRLGESVVVGGPSQGPSKSSFSSGLSSGGNYSGSCGPSQSSGLSSDTSIDRDTRQSCKLRRRQRQHPICGVSTRRHEGPCQRGMLGCFQCGTIGHFLRDCPLVAQSCGASQTHQTENASRSGAHSGGHARDQGRVFAITQHEAHGHFVDTTVDIDVRRSRRHRQHPVCGACTRRHEGPCQRGMLGCFQCGTIGHFLKDCPLVTRSGGALQTNEGQGQGQGQKGTQIVGNASSSEAHSGGHARDHGEVFAITHEAHAASAMEQRLANTWCMTMNEKKFIETALLSDLRIDGRRPFDYRKLTIKFGKGEGSVEVHLGQTHVMAFVTAQLAEPYCDRPNDGTLSIFTEFSPMADPSFEPGCPSESAIEFSREIDCRFRESRAVDTESLCVLSGKLVWAVRVDLHMLDNGGNLIDAANIAALAALLTFRRPECSLRGGDGREVIVHPPEEREPLHLIIHHLPIAVTFAFISYESSVVLDPTHHEEAIMGGRMTATLNANGDVCAIQKAGGEAVLPSAIMQCLRIASVKAGAMTEKIKKAVDSYNTERA